MALKQKRFIPQPGSTPPIAGRFWSFRSAKFKKLWNALPWDAKSAAESTFLKWKANPFNPILEWKENYHSVWRISIGIFWRAICRVDGNVVIWTWIGTHEAYNRQKNGFNLKSFMKTAQQSPQYTSLADAYPPGGTQVWYWKQEYARDMMTQHGTRPDPSDLQKTHVLIGTLTETDPETIFHMMQGEAWSPMGEAKTMIGKSGSGHTSMSVGDILVVNGQVKMVDNAGFLDL